MKAFPDCSHASQIQVFGNENHLFPYNHINLKGFSFSKMYYYYQQLQRTLPSKFSCQYLFWVITKCVALQLTTSLSSHCNEHTIVLILLVYSHSKFNFKLIYGRLEINCENKTILAAIITSKLSFKNCYCLKSLLYTLVLVSLLMGYVGQELQDEPANHILPSQTSIP